MEKYFKSHKIFSILFTRKLNYFKCIGKVNQWMKLLTSWRGKLEV